MRKLEKFTAFFLAVVLLLSLATPVLAAPAADTEGMTFTAADQMLIGKAFAQSPNTFEAWVKFPTNFQTVKDRGGVILGNYNDGPNPCVNFEIFSNGYPRIYYIDKNGTVHQQVFDNATVYTGKWTHVAIVNDAAQGKLKCYIDGQLKQTVNKVLPQNICSNVAVIGGDLRPGNDRAFGGELYCVALYTDARTQAEIQADMQAVGKDGLLAAWDLAEAPANGIIADKSGNGYNSTYPWFTEKEPAGDYDYSFAVVGDTQVVNYYEPEKLANIYDWIVDNKEEKKIQYVMGMGDITEMNYTVEWENAKTQFAKLDAASIGYSLVRGNHDTSAQFNRHLNKAPYNQSFAGSYNENLEDTWREIEVCGIKYLIFTLDIGPSDEVLNWVSDVIEEHPNHNVIITTHVYLYRDGTTLDANDICPATICGGYNNGDQMWDKLIKKHENIVLVLSGHDPCDYVVATQTPGEKGNIVTQMLIDPQGVDAENGATGMITMLYFSEGGTKITVETYSTVRKAYYRQENQYELTVPVVVAPKTLKITKQPESTLEEKGQMAVVTVGAEGEGLSYKWYYKNKGASKFSLTNSFKGSSYRVEMSAARAGRQIYCVITDKYGNTVTTDTVTLNMKTVAKITKNLSSVNVVSGKTAKVSVSAVGDGLSYKWYYKNKGASKFSLTTSFTGNTYSVKMNSTRAGRQIYCVITDKYGNTVTTDTVTLNMKTVAKITKNLSSVNVVSGKTAKVSVSAVGDGLSYKWYYKNKGASKFSLTTSFTGNTYSVKMNSTRAGRQIYCVITDKYGNKVTTKTVTLNLKTVAKITDSPDSTSVKKGATAKFTVKAVGDGITYQWQVKTPSGSWKNTTISGYKTKTICVPATKARNGYYYRCVITDKYGNKVYSSSAKLTVK